MALQAAMKLHDLMRFILCANITVREKVSILRAIGHYNNCVAGAFVECLSGLWSHHASISNGQRGYCLCLAILLTPNDHEF
jgi:hypothetical protein